MTSLIIFSAKYLFAAAALVLLWTFWKLSAEDRRTLMLRGAIVLIMSVILAKGGGALYNEPRPFVIHHINPLIPHEADNGFPSDHTLLTFACAFLLLPFSRPAAGLSCLIAALVGLARIASSLHSPIDIFAAILMAALANLLACTLIRRSGSAEASASAAE